MATTIQVKRSTSVTDGSGAGTIGAVSLAYGELAYSFEGATNKLWIGDSSNDAVTIGGSYFTGLFSSNVTSGTNGTGKILISNSTDGSLDFNAKNLTNVGNFDSNQIIVGNTSKTATITNTGDVLGITAATGIDLKMSTDAGIVFDTTDGITGTGIKDEDAMTSNSAVHLVTQQSIKAYVDAGDTSVDKILEGNSSVEVIDAGTGSIVNTVDANATLTIAAADATMKATDFRLKLASAESGGSATTQDGADTALQFLDNASSVLGEIKGAHDGTSSEDKGVLILSTNTGAASTEAVRIDSEQNVIIAGDLTVNGTRNIVNTTITSLDDPVLTLGGEFAGVATFSSGSQPSTAWTVNMVETVVEQYSTNGAGQGAAFRISTNASGQITVNGVSGVGQGYVASATIVVRDPNNAVVGTNFVITVSTIVAGPTADDNKDRGIEFNYYSGSAKLGFFGFDDSSGKFTFIPEASKTTAEVFSGTAGTIVADVEGDITANVTGNLSGTVNTVTQNSITTMTGLATVGTLSAGIIDASATNNFPITMGTSDFTSSGQIVIDVDGSAVSTDGAITLGAGADGGLWVDSSNDLNVYNQGETIIFDASNFEFFNKESISGDHTSDLYVGKTATEALKLTSKMNSSNELVDVTFDTPTASSTANRGQYVWKLDGQQLFTIGDNGISGTTDGGNPFTSPDGVASQSIPYIDNFIISGGTFT